MEPKPLYHGYTDKRLRINVTDNTIDAIDIPQEVKENLPAAKVIACVICGINESRYKVELSGKCHYHVGRTDCRNYAVRRYRKMPGMQHFTDDRYPD